jgi:hypothetical protein
VRWPIGVWIVTAYLLVLLALGMLYLAAAVGGGSLPFIIERMVAVSVVLSSAVFLLSRSRWAVLAIGTLAVTQARSYLAYFAESGTHFMQVQGSDTVVHVVSFTYVQGPLVLMGATGGALLYAAWLWRRGVLN